MLRTRWAAMMICIAASFLLASSARATPVTPAITVQQQGTLQMQLTSSTGTHWAWTILDTGGRTVNAAAANPATLTFAAPGGYIAQLDATDDDPLAPAPAHAEAAFHVYATPVAAFTYTQLPGGTVQFADTSASEPTAWTWSFPGSTYEGHVPPAQTLPAGTSTVSLKVTNPAGTSTISIPVVVNGPPQPVLTVTSSPAAINAPILLDASRSTDPNQDPLTYSWDLDGNGQFGDATGALQIVSYATPGTYRVAVQVSDGHGAISTAEAAIVVLVDQAPAVTFANDPVQPLVGATVGFTATAADPDGSVTRIEWDLDDDGQFDDAAGATATWSFRTAGQHRVAVRATDDRGVATVAFRTIDVVSPAASGPAGGVVAASTAAPAPSSAPGPALPSGAPAAARAPMLAPFPVVRLRGLLYRGAVRITLLKVQAPPGATIRVRCRGGSCTPARADVRVRAARSPVRVRSLEGRSLSVGTVIEVFVTAPDEIGKYTRFRVRRHATPARTDLCLVPGRSKPTACPPACSSRVRRCSWCWPWPCRARWAAGCSARSRPGACRRPARHPR
jgi:PKD repeat protein